METVQGQTAKTMLDGIIGTEDYKNLPDDLKAKVFDKVYDYAREKARSEALEGYPAPDIGTPEEFAETVVRDSLVGASKLSEADYDAAVKAGFTLEQMQNVSKVKKEFSGYFSDLTDGWKNGDQGMSTAALDDAYGDFTLLPYDQQKFITDRLSGREEAFFEAKKAQIPSQTFVGLYKEYCDIGKREDLTSAQKAREWSHALEKARQSGKLNYMSTEVMRKELTYQSGFTADDGKYGGMVDAGASPDGAKLVADLMDSIVGTGNIDKKTGKPSITADDRYQAIATSSLGESDKDIAMKAYMDDYDPTSKNPDTTELKYDYLRKEIGLTPEQYAIVRAAYGRAGTKDRIQRTAVRNALNNAPHSEKVFRILDGKEKKLLIELYG